MPNLFNSIQQRYAQMNQSVAPFASEHIDMSQPLDVSMSATSTLPFPLFIRFNVAIHGNQNRFHSVSIHDLEASDSVLQQLNEKLKSDTSSSSSSTGGWSRTRRRIASR